MIGWHDCHDTTKLDWWWETERGVVFGRGFHAGLETSYPSVMAEELLLHPTQPLESPTAVLAILRVPLSWFPSYICDTSTWTQLSPANDVFDEMIQVAAVTTQSFVLRSGDLENVGISFGCSHEWVVQVLESKKLPNISAAAFGSEDRDAVAGHCQCRKRRPSSESLPSRHVLQESASRILNLQEGRKKKDRSH